MIDEPSSVPEVIAPPTRSKQLLSVILQPRYTLTILLVIQVIITGVFLQRTVNDRTRLEWFLHGDTGTYLGIARHFSAGDFSMSWVKKRPHRVPLYPAALAVALRVSPENPTGYAVVNTVIACLLLSAIYLTVLGLFQNRAVAALLGVATLSNRFLIEFNTERLMTEPLFVTVTVLACHFFVQYVRHHRGTDLLWMSFCCCLAYLTRINGLFFTLVLIGLSFCYDFARIFPQPRGEFSRGLRRLLLRWALTGAVIFTASALNWWPRWIYFHNLIAHGYPTNFLWVDTMEQAVTGQPFPSFTWKDYVATHHFSDFWQRLMLGVYRVAITIPIRSEPCGFPYWLAVTGIGIAIARRKTEFILLTLAMVGVLLPSMWTYLPNQVWRIPYSSFLPFEFLLTALALDFGIRQFLQAMTQRNSQAGSAIQPIAEIGEEKMRRPPLTSPT